jgi:CheY-like chemotaxis protein
MMPVMDGWEFRAAQLRDSAIADIPVVVMTAGGNLHVNPISVSDILRKPVGIERLLETVGRYCDRSATTKP